MTFKRFDEIKSNFNFMDEWEDRYAYIVELGREMPQLSECLKTENNKVVGCASQVWISLETYNENNLDLLQFRGDSDALIVRGLVSIVGSIYDKLPVSEIPRIDPFVKFKELDLLNHLSTQRSNGLFSLVKKIQHYS